MMFTTTYQKQSVIITAIIMVLVVFLMFFCGLRYLDPPEEYGVAINFGTSELGSGTPKLNESIQSNPTPSQAESITEKVENSAIEEKVITQADVEAPVIKPKEKKEEKTVKAPEKKTEEKKVEKPVEKKEPTPTREIQNALNSLFGNPSKGEVVEGEGDDKTQGVKGSTTGDPNSDKYYGNNGSGGDGNYLLQGRRALSKPIRKPDCNEEGIVVVRIEVDVNGKVISAVPGVKGTTNNSPCLLEPAKKAALATQWNPDGNAPNKQVGLIRYKFILSE
ncbi:energy transducer TonB [Wenyingzhuangia sp. IMCC45467]